MLNYLNFINESFSSDSTEDVYWNIDELIEKDWIDLCTKRAEVIFSLKEKDLKYNSSTEQKKYGVYLDPENKEKVLLPDSFKDKFWEKFKKEFDKNPGSYAKNLQYVPKCVGDIKPWVEADKFGL